MHANEKRVVCFPPIEVVERHTGENDIPIGWTICRGSWYVTEDEAVAMMSGTLQPIVQGEAHRPVYRCPQVRNQLHSSGTIERRRCSICCRRDRIKQHANCKFECEERFDAMAPKRATVRELSTEKYTRRYKQCLIKGLMRCGVPCARIASRASLEMARELIQVGIDAQYSSQKLNAKLRVCSSMPCYARNSRQSYIPGDSLDHGRVTKSKLGHE